MTRNTQHPQDLTTIIAAMDKRIRVLERSQQLDRSRVPLNPDSSVGSAAAFEVNSAGLITPYVTTFWQPVKSVTFGLFAAVANASFEDVWETTTEILIHPDIQFHFDVGSDSGTVGQVRVRDNNSGAVTGTVTTTAAALQTVSVAWAHGQTLGGGPVRYSIQALRQSGAGNINVWVPSTFTMRGNTAVLADGISIA